MSITSENTPAVKSPKHSGAKRSELYWHNPTALTIVGLDTPHTAGTHPLFDERALLPLDEQAEAMISNIMQYGVLEPVLVDRNGTAYEVIDGRQRVRCARVANERLVAAGYAPVLVPTMFKHGLDDRALFGVMVTTNEVRRDDGPIVKAEKAARMEALGASRKDIAIAFGVTEAAVSGWIKLAGLHSAVKAAIADGKLSAKAAMPLAGCAREEQPKILAEMLAPAQVPATLGNGTAIVDAPAGRFQVLEGGAGKDADEPKPEPKPRKLTTKDVDAKLKGGKDASASPTLRELKKLVAMEADGKLDAALSADFIAVVRVLIGELPVTRIAGLKSALAQIREE